MEQIILKYLKEFTGQWIHKVNLYVLGDTYGYSPETVARCCRILAEKGTISKKYYDGKYAKNLVEYSYMPKPDTKPKITIVDNLDGTRTAVMSN